jgi:dienelactone hydrolase
VIRVTIDDQTARLLCAPAAGGTGAAKGPGSEAAGKALAKSRAPDDVLEASALGYETKSVPVTSYEGKVDITLESAFKGSCVASQSVNTTAKGSGPHAVVVETNAGEGIKEGTLYRPADLGPGKRYPIVVWGEGACAKDGLDNLASMAELASHGYFVIADGTPNGTGSRPMNANNLEEMGRPMLAYINWALAENRKPCSKYYGSLDTSKIGANGFSCGGLLSMGTAKDPRTTTWGLTSSGSFSDNPTLWNAVHTPVLIIEGHQDATGAYTNGLRDYNGIAALGHPVLFMSHRNLGHGGDLWSANGGDFTRIHLAWLNWWLKGDVGATGKGRLVGAGCTYCTSSNWEVKSSKLP